MKIRTKFFLVVILIAVIPIIAGVFVLNNTVQVVEDSVTETSARVSILKENVLEAYIEETQEIGSFFQQSEVVQEYIEYLGDGSNTELEEEVIDLLYSFQETRWGKYHHMFLFDQTEKIILSPNHGAKITGSPSSHLGEDTSNNKWASEALKMGVPTVSDYSSWSESDHSHQMMFYPLKDSAGNTKAVIGFEMQIPHELSILSQDIELGKAGKAFIVSDTGTSITYELPENQITLNSLGIREALTNGYFSGVTVSEEGVDVIGTYSKHDKYPWVLAVEIDREEAFKNINVIQNFFMISMAFAVLLVITLSYFLINSLVNPIKELTKIAKSIASGNLKVRSKIKSQDEIGEMSQAYNKMADTILASQSGLEEKVRARTDELDKKTEELDKKTKELTTKKDELETVNEYMTGRELRMAELKKEIKKLKGDNTTDSH